MNPVFKDPTADAVLKCISQILMEEESDEQTFMARDFSIRAAEKPFSDILDPKSSSSYGEVSDPDQIIKTVSAHCCNIYGCNSSVPADNMAVSRFIRNREAPSVNYSVPLSLQVESLPSFFPESVFQTFPEQVDSSVNVALGETEETWEFHQQENEMILDFENNKVTPVMGTKEKSCRDHSACELKERKNHYRVEKESGTKRNKHSSDEAADQHGIFADVFPSTGGDDEPVWLNLNETFQNGPGMMPYLKEQSRGSNYGMISMKNQVRCREMVDTRTLLIHCAEAVAGNDHGSAIELLTQIRQHSTPFGDGSQRLAHCFSNALEARMAGTGSEVYANLAANRVTAECILKASRRFISASPFIVMLHIIHFGILYGFPWPSLIQHLSVRPGGPPVLRVTGIEFPQTEMGPYLASYCEKFNVPFEYNARSQKWENVQLEDLKIDRDEVTVVSSLYRFRRLLDETVVLNGHRDAVISLIKRINPAVFIHGIVNGAYNSPFFVSRFREALFYFSSLFDMLEANTAREDPERLVFEQEVFGKEILNVIACEGCDRIERPEKYKQWQARNVRAGLRQLPLKEGIMEKVREQVKSSYHKDFLMDQDGQWMLQGWRGRILFAISCWKSA
ncbi:scarecrow protein [Salix suchowensis]|nr:scarecrow protein [Salix suchowensis]